MRPLVALPTDRLKKIALPDDLRDAVVTAQRMSRQDEAKRRQMQYIGRLMRKADTEPIRAALADARGEFGQRDCAPAPAGETEDSPSGRREDFAGDRQRLSGDRPAASALIAPSRA